MNTFDDDPGQCTRGSGNLCSCKSLCRAQSAGQAATCVESEPTYPEKSCADHGHNKIVRTHGKMRIEFSSTNEDGCDKTADTSRDVYNSTAGEVDGASSTEVEEESVFSPYPVCEGIVYENTPQCDEPAVCLERNAFSKSAGDRKSVV